MKREIERGNNINLTNLLTLLENVFPHEQQQADNTLYQALIAATVHIALLAQRIYRAGSSRRINRLKQTATSTARTSTSTTKSKQNPSHGNGYSAQ